MHPKFAKRIANHLYVLKWKHGYKLPALTKWLAERLPNLSSEDAAQIRESLPANFHGGGKP